MNADLSPFKRLNGPDAFWLGHLSRHDVMVDSCRVSQRGTSTFFRVLNHFSEPPPIIANEEEVISHAEEYDLILTYSDRICATLENAVYFPFGSSMVPKCDKDLNDGISFIFSEGAAQIWDLEGYKLRFQVLQRLAEKKATHVKLFYTTRRHIRPESWSLLHGLIDEGRAAPLLDDKALALSSKYAIVIENTIVNGYFTEKIVDCLRRKVIPLYIGCPNIARFFDDDGIVCCSDTDQIFNSIDRILRGEMIYSPSSVERNFEISEYYASTKERFQAVLETFLYRNKAMKYNTWSTL